MTTVERTNEAWVATLKDSPDHSGRYGSARAAVARTAYALKQYHVTESDLEDFAQDALVKVLDNVQTFRGESKFTTWAQKIAIRVAFSELRRKRWRTSRCRTWSRMSRPMRTRAIVRLWTGWRRPGHA